MPKQDNHFDRMQEQSAMIRVIENLRVCWVMLFLFLIRQLDIIWHRYSFFVFFLVFTHDVEKSLNQVMKRKIVYKTDIPVDRKSK